VRSNERGSVDGGYDTTRVNVAASEADRLRRIARDDQARHNLAAMALKQPDPEAWLRDVIGALGL
jgi:hypothetical protein